MISIAYITYADCSYMHLRSLYNFPISLFVLVYMCIYLCFPQAILNVIGELKKIYGMF